MQEYVIRAHIPAYADCLCEAEIQELWKLLCVDGREKVLFYDGGVKDDAAFIRFVQDAGNYVYAVQVDGQFQCIAWVNNFLGRCGMIHFAMFSCCAGQEYAVGSYLLHFLLFAQM